MSFLSSVIRAPSKAAIQTAARVASVVPLDNNNKPSMMASNISRHSSTSAKKKTSLVTMDLVNLVSETHKLKKAESKRVIDTLFDTIVETLKDNKVVHLSKFGSFETYTSKATKKRNPKTGEPVQVPEKKKIRFRPYKDFKETIEGSKK